MTCHRFGFRKVLRLFHASNPTASTLLGRVGSEPRRATGEGRFSAYVRGQRTDHRTDPPRRLVPLARDPPKEGGIGGRRVAGESIATATPQRCSSTFLHSFVPSFLHSFTHSFTHSLIHSLIHSFIPFQASNPTVNRKGLFQSAHGPSPPSPLPFVPQGRGGTNR